MGSWTAGLFDIFVKRLLSRWGLERGMGLSGSNRSELEVPAEH